MSAAPQVQPYAANAAQTGVAGLIVSEVVRECRRSHAKALQAVVLTGSLARGEATLLLDDGIRRILGDADFLLVFRRKSLIPPEADIQQMQNRIMRSLDELGIACPVHLACVTPRYFTRLPRYIFTYELCAAGNVVMGDKEILAAIPKFGSGEIDREDAWRLLSNRMIEWLEALAGAAPNRRGVDRSLFYATVKLWIDAATSTLVFLQAFEPGYLARSQRLASLAQSPILPARIPFPLSQLSRGVSAATRWKLLPETTESEQLGWAFCEEVRRLVGILWCWETAQLTRFDAASAPLTILRCSRPDRARLRGWLRTARERKRLGLPRPWRHWWALGRWGSPRRCIYAVAAECLLRSDDFGPCVDGGLASQLREGKLRQFLPIPDPFPQSEDGEGWRRLLRELAWNYHQFVERTRA
jgi:hypothetical protein